MLTHTFFDKIEPKRYFYQIKNTLFLVIVLVLIFKCFLHKKDRLGESTKNERLKNLGKKKKQEKTLV